MAANSQHSFTVYRGQSSGHVTPATTTHGPLKNDEVYLQVTASGVCGTDLHYRNADIALGHEGVGIVKQLGPGVKHLKVGDRVGWGYEHDCCGECDQCLTGTETYCPERHMYGSHETDQGSFATGAVWREAFLFHVPESLSDEDAAPLMCGGATVFNALRMYDTQPTDRVGVVGVGGLGHLAIQFASRMGCHVTVLSGTESKKDEAIKLGASDFFAMKGVKAGELDIGRGLDKLIVTASHVPDWDIYLAMLAPKATIFPLTVSGGKLDVPYGPVLQKGLRVQGTIVAPRHIHRQMLEFAALHKVKPMINKYSMDEQGVNDVMDALEGGKLRYRGVLIPQAGANGQKL